MSHAGGGREERVGGGREVGAGWWEEEGRWGEVGGEPGGEGRWGKEGRREGYSHESRSIRMNHGAFPWGD